MPSFTKAALVGSLALSCGGSERNEQFVTIPQPPLVEDRPAEEHVPPSDQIKTEVTLLRTGNIFLAYVTVPSEDPVHDQADAKVSFFYRGSTKAWRPIIECQAVTYCDVSGVLSHFSPPVTIKAKFSPEYGSHYSFSSAEHTIR
jgi:hypothetical protein